MEPVATQAWWQFTGAQAQGQLASPGGLPVSTEGRVVTKQDLRKEGSLEGQRGWYNQSTGVQKSIGCRAQ